MQNTADKAVLQVDQVLAQAMSNVKTLVGSLPEESLLRGRAWKDLEPLVRQELNVYGQQLGSAIENALVDAEPEMERAAIRQARLGGADFGPEAVSINPVGGRLQGTVEMALNSRVNNVTVKRLFNIDGKTKTAAIDKSLFRTVDTAVRAGMINGTPTDEIARSMIGEVKRAGIPGVDINSGKVSKQIRTQANAIARTATQDMSRQVKQEVYDANADAMEGMEWQWTTALDSRTCETCSPLDGRRWKDQKDVPGWPLHPNCRCQSLPVDPEDPFWDNSEVTAQVIRPFEKGAYADGYKTPVKINGKKFYRQAVTVTSDAPPTRYSDVLARWATSSQTSLEEALGPTRARWFKKEYDRLNKDPQQILQAMLTGKPGAQKFIPIEKLLTKEVKLPAKRVVKKAAPKPKVAAPKAVAKPATPKQTDRDYIQAHQFDNGKNKLSHDAIADSMEIAARENGLAGQHMRQMMAFARKKEIQTIWSNGREKVIGPDFNHWADTDIIKALRAGKGKGEGVVKDVADALEKGQKSPFLHTIGRVSSGAGGHTIEAAHIVVMKQESQYVKLAKSGIEKIRAAIRNSVTQSAAGKPMQVATKDLYKKTGKTTWKTTEGWLGTYVHEMGHQVHFRAGRPSIGEYIRGGMDGLSPLQQNLEIRKRNWYPSKYGMTNEMEQFAETFVQYVFAPDELKKASPAAYKWVEDAIKKGLK